MFLEILHSPLRNLTLLALRLVLAGPWYAYLIPGRTVLPMLRQLVLLLTGAPTLIPILDPRRRLLNTGPSQTLYTNLVHKRRYP
jgi:hypothetical protein